MIHGFLQDKTAAFNQGQNKEFPTTFENPLLPTIFMPALLGVVTCFGYR